MFFTLTCRAAYDICTHDKSIFDGFQKSKKEARMKKETGQTVRELAYFASLGMSVALSIVIGLFAGYWLDKKFDTGPVLLLIGLAFGIAAGFSNIVRAGKKGSKY